MRVTDGGYALPLLMVSPAQVTAQVPWEMRGVVLLSLLETESPFEERLTRQVRVVDTAVQMEYVGSHPAVVHQDFRGLVTDTDPASPGEILHFYLTGLGAVAPAVKTGQPAPSSPLSYITERVFSFWQGSLLLSPPPSGPEVLFAGLAPGMVGIYQVDMQMPEFAPPGELTVSIQVGNSSAAATFQMETRRERHP